MNDNESGWERWLVGNSLSNHGVLTLLAVVVIGGFLLGYYSPSVQLEECQENLIGKYPSPDSFRINGSDCNNCKLSKLISVNGKWIYDIEKPSSYVECSGDTCSILMNNILVDVNKVMYEHFCVVFPEPNDGIIIPPRKVEAEQQPECVDNGFFKECEVPE